MAHVLFVCLQNAGRSQMSHALFEQRANGEHEGRSAGTRPADHVHPEVVEAMREVGVDLGGRKPQPLTEELAEWADIVVTMGCGDECPYIPGRRYLDWELPDPHGRPMEEVRATRDEISRRIDDLLAEELRKAGAGRAVSSDRVWGRPHAQPAQAAADEKGETGGYGHSDRHRSRHAAQPGDGGYDR